MALSVRRTRRLPTLLAAGLVAGVVVAAVVDAVRAPEREPARAAEEADTGPEPLDSPALAEALRAAGAEGVLVTVDSACRVAGFELPGLEPAPVPGRACRLVQSGGRLALDGRLASPADPSLLARCRGGMLEILSGADRAAAAAVERTGCAPAWKPDGTLTSLADGELLALDVDGRVLRPRVLLSHAELRRMLWEALPSRQAPSPELREVVWPEDDRLLAIVETGAESGFLLAVVSAGRLETWRCCFQVLRHLRLSPSRSYADVGFERGVLLFTAGGTPLELPWTAHPTAVAWSPDDRWLAAARAQSLDVVDPAESALRSVVRLPLVVRDVAWTDAPLDLVPGDEPR